MFCLDGVRLEIQKCVQTPQIILIVLCSLLWSSPVAESAKNTQCFREPEDLGCFHKNADDPRAIWPTFQLFKPASTGHQEVNLWLLDQSVEAVSMDKSRELFVCVHGFLGSSNTFYDMKDLLISKGKNVILADWEQGARIALRLNIGYKQATLNARVMGAITAAVLRRLDQRNKINLAKTTIIGLSLGAHVAGFAGKRLQAQGLNGIIGLDPAGPLFTKRPVDERLDPSDARFVQVIHTDAGGLGSRQSMGHVDFFANGGNRQPGCGSLRTCSHLKAVKYMEGLIRQGSSNPCVPAPGLQTDRGSVHRGRYDFQTNSDGGCEEIHER